MKSPICEICLKSGILCLSCQEKKSKGYVSDKDIQILDLLHKESQKNKDLSAIEIKKIINGQEMTLIVCSAGDGAKIVGKSGYFAKKLQQIVGKPLRIVEESSDIREFLQKIIFPAPILSLNVLYTSKGDKYRIVIPKNSRLPVPLNSFIKMAKSLLDKEVEIAFEDRGSQKVDASRPRN